MIYLDYFQPPFHLTTFRFLFTVTICYLRKVIYFLESFAITILEIIIINLAQYYTFYFFSIKFQIKEGLSDLNYYSHCFI